MFLGIDVGTSEVKVVLVDGSQRLLAVARAGLDVSRPQPHWSEQDPDSWWRATRSAVAEIRRGHAAELAAVRGVGLSGQMHGATLLDGADRVLRPAILWNDARSADECAELERRVPASRTIVGNMAMPGFTAPKLLWVARHEPEVMRQVAKVLLPKDYVRLCLTGEHVSDMSDSAGTMWLDVARREWSDVMLAATGLDRRHMPRLVEGTMPGGQLRPEVARDWGMGDGVVVAGGGGDNAASAVGLGVVAEGQGFISLGTSGVFFLARSGYRPDPDRGVHTFCHALPGVWHHMAVMLSAASCLRWITHATGAADEGALIQEVEARGIETLARTAPIFLPYLSGERTPHNDAYAQGVLFGLSHGTDRAALGYSVLEGIAFGLADGYGALRDAGGVARSVSLTGGGSRSRTWARLIASMVELPLALPEGSEVGAALGAARTGMLAAGEGTVESVCRPPPIVETIEPVAEWRETLQTRYGRFRELYPPLRPLFRQAMP